MTFLSPLDGFKKAMTGAGLSRKVVYLSQRDIQRDLRKTVPHPCGRMGPLINHYSNHIPVARTAEPPSDGVGRRRQMIPLSG